MRMLIVLFFSSRRRHTRSKRDWSSDVCSSDLTDLDPFVLLDHCLQVEEELGRVREFRWGPRVIDVDVLLYNDEVIESERLRVPHPRMEERSFVLIPLLEIHADLVDPSTHRPYSTILSSLTDKESVRKWKEVQDVHEFL